MTIYPIDEQLISIIKDDMDLLGTGDILDCQLFSLVIPKNNKAGNKLKIVSADTASRKFTLDVTL